MVSKYARFLPEVFSIVAVAAAHYYLYVWLSRHRSGKPMGNSRPWMKLLWINDSFVRGFFVLSTLFVWLGIAMQMPKMARLLPYSDWQIWSRGLAIAYGIVICLLFATAAAGRLIARPLRRQCETDPVRRALLSAASNAALTAPLAVIGFGIIVERRKFILKEVRIPIANLPKELEGFTMVQLTDMHVSPYLEPKDLARAVDMANETKAKLALVTGDLITAAGDPLDACIAELARLRADAGVFGCMGNHEIYAQSEAYTAQQAARFGMRFLRGEAKALRFGSATLNLAGVDYQPFGKIYLPHAAELVAKTERTVNILLSHNPDVFPVAADQGWDLTLAGHTHGGQVTFELLSRHLNIARFFTPYVQGTYERNGKSIFVSRGLGTVGVPARVGAPPEVVLVKLCAT